MGICNVEYIVSAAAKRAGITKHVYPHLLRHSIVSWRSKQGMTGAESNLCFGWSAKSRMIEHYYHTDVEDVNDRQRKQAGMPVSNPEEDKPLKRFEYCPNCDKNYPVGHAVCESCNLPLDNQKRMEMLMTAQRQTALLEGMKRIEPILTKIMPGLEKTIASGGVDRLLQVLEAANAQPQLQQQFRVDREAHGGYIG